MLRKLLSYYRECYRADLRAIQLFNYYGRKVSHRLILSEPDVLSGKQLQYPVSTQWGQELEKLLLLYSKEKSLYCFSFFVKGMTSVGGRQHQMCAPLYLHPAQLLVEDEVYYVSLEAAAPVINTAIVNCVDDASQNIHDILTDDLPKGYLGFDEMVTLEDQLRKHLPNIDISALDNFPDLTTENTLKKDRPDQGFVMHPFVALGLMDKPVGARGVLNELETLSEAERHSPLLQQLFFPKKKQSRQKRKKTDLNIPLSLSTTQAKIIAEAKAQTPVQAVIGPPGTGKSFTIAALAVEYMANGRSVLIASKNTQAVKVVADKIEQDFGLRDIVVRASRTDYKALLQKRIDQLLRGIGVKDISRDILSDKVKKAKQQKRSVDKKKLALLSHQEEEMYNGQLMHAPGTFWFGQWRLKRLKARLAKQIPFWRIMEEFAREQAAHYQLLSKLIVDQFHFYLSKSLEQKRASFRTLHKAIRARTGNRKARFFEALEFKDVLHAFPIWVVNATDVDRVLPLQTGLFDLVIIDEASQCDITSSLPIIERGQQLVVVGDTAQLRHISFLSTRQQDQLQQQFGLQSQARLEDMLDYRRTSLLDLSLATIVRQQHVHFLDEHFRSMPDIIDFSNQQFYNRQLKIMSACPATLKRQHQAVRTINGRRHGKGYNSEEVEAVINFLQKMIERERSLAPNLCQSIGVLSPFRAQVNRLQQTLTEALGEEVLLRHQILIGTPYDFQGEERDIMLLSMALDNDSHSVAFRYLEREDIFNVSITRARSRQEVFISFDPRRLAAKSLLRKWVIGIQEWQQKHRAIHSTGDEDVFLQEVVNFLDKELQADEIYTAFPIAGTEVDIVVVKAGQTSCIDLIGYPGAYEAALPLNRWEMLGRVGLEALVMPYSHWVEQREAAKIALRHLVEKG